MNWRKSLDTYISALPVGYSIERLEPGVWWLLDKRGVALFRTGTIAGCMLVAEIHHILNGHPEGEGIP